jgi:hypothetical protein
VARTPQTTVPPFFEQPPTPAPAGLLVALAAVGLLLVSMLGTIVKEIAKRWRGVVVAHLFFLTLWMAVQVFFFATGAYWCLPSDSSAAVEWVSKYMTHIARCGPAPRTLPAFQGSTAAAAPAPVPPRPPATVPASPPQAAAPPPPAAPPPATLAPVPARPVPGWSSRAIQNCWRNRAVDSGDCYDNNYPPRSALPPPPLAPPPALVPKSPDGVEGFYYRNPSPIPAPYPCHRGYDCWPEDYYYYDDDR